MDAISGIHHLFPKHVVKRESLPELRKTMLEPVEGKFMAGFAFLPCGCKSIPGHNSRMWGKGWKVFSSFSNFTKCKFYLKIIFLFSYITLPCFSNDGISMTKGTTFQCSMDLEVLKVRIH